ncbi:MAG: hypothetical protein HQL91_07370, partial [Magnetococcales bacterium]|nr:hypothetical protein [Magnetococcales bacterium]
MNMKLDSFIAPVPAGATFLAPLWRDEQGLLYWQKVDEEGRVESFISFGDIWIDDDRLKVRKKSGLTKSVTVGAMAPLAFRFADGSVVCALPKKMREILQPRIGEFQDNPLLQFEILNRLQIVDGMEAIRERGRVFLKDQCSERVAEDWWQESFKHQQWIRKRLAFGRPSGYPHILVMDAPYLADLPGADESLARDYLRGGLPDLRLVHDHVPVELSWVSRAMEVLRTQSAVLLKGPAGSGKSTALLQIGCRLLAERGFRKVFWLDPLSAKPRELLSNESDPVVLLIDHADVCHVLPDLLSVLAQRHQTCKVVCAARSNEWRVGVHYSRLSNRIECVSSEPLNAQNIAALAQAIVTRQVADQAVTAEEILARLHENRAKDLLAVMILATRGKPLDDILRDLVANLHEQPDGRGVTALLAAVAGLEVRCDVKGRIQPATRTLLGSFLRYSPDNLHFALRRLEGELTLRQREVRRGTSRQYLFQEICTRHPAIAASLWRILTQEPGAPIDPLKLDIALFDGAARACQQGRKDTPERVFTSFLLNIRPERSLEDSRKLFARIETQSPGNPYLWQTWGRFEQRCGNFGNVDIPHSARWLFKQGTQADAKNAPTWQAWALMEKEQGNIGSVETEYSARWLFKQGTQADAKNAPTWQAWAVMEKEQRNIGSVEREYSARWLFKQGTQADAKHAPTWQAWAVMEKEQGNIGSVEREYSARWLFKQGTQADAKDAPTWQAWALMEKEQGNIGSVE